jgi:hypothetical protein
MHTEDFKPLCFEALLPESPSDRRVFGVRLHAVKNGTLRSNPKRQRGQKLRPSLTLRVTIRVNRVQDNRPGGSGMTGVLNQC